MDARRLDTGDCSQPDCGDLPMIFSVHTPTCSIHFEEVDGRWVQKTVFNPRHHRPLNDGERDPLVVRKDNELIVRTDWAAMLREASEDELRGRTK